MSNNSDNWSNLLNDFGIEDAAKQDNAEQAVSVDAHTGTTGVETVAEITNSATVTTTSSVEEVVPPKSKERKSIFSRFPKINIFGLPPKDQIDAITNAGKSPSLAGKSFTGGTIEKTQGIVRRQETENRRPEAGDRKPEEQATSGRGRGKRHEADLPATRSTQQQDSALPSIVSQLDTIASGEKPGRGRHRQPPVSLFEEPAPESDEYKALKNIFDDPAEKSRNPRRGEGRREYQQEDRYSKRQPIVVVDDVTLEDEWQEVDDEPVVVEERPRNRRGSFNNPEGQRNNNREQQQPRTNDRNYPPKRGGVISGDRVVQHDIDEPAEDRNRSYGRGRGNRNAPEGGNTPQRNYAPRDNYSRNNRNAPRDNYARDDHNAPEGGNAPQRNVAPRDSFARDDRNAPDGGRNYAPRTMGERVVEREPIVEREYESDNDSAFIEDEENQVQLHRNIPGWGDAIDDIIAGNMTRHRNNQPYRDHQPYRGKR
ncbi:hypothetical protein FACS1894170_02500 [Planctomycetales bacterium]|nr:hypothetical protein FACS1894170_02500 [Planctomycetales bacterium]